MEVFQRAVLSITAAKNWRRTRLLRLCRAGPGKKHEQPRQLDATGAEADPSFRNRCYPADDRSGGQPESRGLQSE